MERVGSLTGVEKELSLLDSLIHHHAGSLSLKSAFMKKRNYHRLTNLVRSIDLQESRELKQLRKWRNAFASQK